MVWVAVCQKLSVELDGGTALAGSPLSMPSAAEGGGRRPAFTGGCQPATIAQRDRWLIACHNTAARPLRRQSQALLCLGGSAPPATHRLCAFNGNILGEAMNPAR